MGKQIYTYEYPRPAVTTDCVIFGYDVKEGLSVLLVQRGIEPFKGSWAFPGGFLKMDETVETCAVRELIEETGLSISTPGMELPEKFYLDETALEGDELTEAPVLSTRRSAFLEQLGCFSDVDRDPRGRVITIAFYAIVEKGRVKGNDDAAVAQWFPIDDIPDLAFDHNRILRLALKRLKERIHFEPVGFGLLPEVFTMPQLQHLYESILGRKFDRRNFASKILRQGILETLPGESDEPFGPHNPTPYRFNEEAYQAMKTVGRTKRFVLEF